MRTKQILWTVAALFLLTIIATGCSSKTSTQQEPAAVEVKDDSQWKTETTEENIEEKPTASESDIDEAAIRREKLAAVQVELSAQIYFAFDSYELNSEAKGLLSVKAEMLKQFEEMTVIIEGHCDDRGTEEYNLALGERRARAAYEHLVILGVSPERMSIVSFGEERPAVAGQNEAAWAANRRAEFKASW